VKRVSLSELLRNGLIEQFQSDAEQVRNEIEIAKRDVSSAKKMIEIQEWEWAHNAAYNAMLQAARGLMFSRGYRPKSEEHHVAVISFVRAVYSAKFRPELLQAFDNARRRRNEALYDRAGTISETQARGLVGKAESFVDRTVELLKMK
jgi:uncharacterized protein (UPF0332 family)